MAYVSLNLGLVQAIFVGVNPPTNTNVLWFDSDDGLHYVYDSDTTSWVPLKGATEFTGLTDAPNSYSGSAGQFIKVNATADGLEFATLSAATNLAYTQGASNGVVTSDTGTDATILAADGTYAGLMIPAQFTKLSYLTITQAVDVDAMELNVSNLVTLTGVASNSTTLGTFTGSTIADSSTIKVAFQAVETALELKLSGSGTSGYLPKYTGSLTQGNSNIYDSSTAIGIFTASPSFDISIGGNAARTLAMERHTTAATAGNNFTMQAGGAYSTGTNLAGGNVLIKPGIATGTGSANVQIWTTTAGGTGATDRNPTLKATFTSTGHLNMEASGYIQFGGYTYLHYTNSGTPAVQTNGCTFLGYNVGLSNANNGNTGIGHEALKTITTGSNNTATGRFAGTELTNGVQNVFNGYYAGSGITTGSYNVVIGANATGGTSGASYNTAIGNNCMTSTPSGSYNVGVGADSCYSVTSGAQNTSIGYNSMNGGTGITGSYNVALGSSAGSYLRTSSAQNTFLGYNTAFLLLEGPFSYSTAIGAGATIRASNTAVIGGGSNVQKVTSFFLGSSPIYTQGDVTQSDILLTVGGTYYSSGANMGGHNLVLGAGLATGTGVNGTTIGDLIFKTTDITGSGSTLGVLQTRMTIKGGSGYMGMQSVTAPTAFLHLAASTTAAASLCIPHGTAPTSPVNGDTWTDSSGWYIRINGVTKTVTLV